MGYLSHAGPCVDFFAPGFHITSCSNEEDEVIVKATPESIFDFCRRASTERGIHKNYEEKRHFYGLLFLTSCLAVFNCFPNLLGGAACRRSNSLHNFAGGRHPNAGNDQRPQSTLLEEHFGSNS